jgi:hypothetical protein
VNQRLVCSLSKLDWFSAVRNAMSLNAGVDQLHSLGEQQPNCCRILVNMMQQNQHILCNNATVSGFSWS